MGRGLGEGHVGEGGDNSTPAGQDEKQFGPLRVSEPLAFERMLTAISGRLVSCEGGNLGQEVEGALRVLAQFFQVDRCTFWERSEDGSRFTISHSYQTQDGVIPSTVQATSLPWFLKELSAGRAVHLESASDLPPAAVNERRYWTEHGLLSALLVPVSVGARLTGCFSLASTQAECKWPLDLVERLRLAGELFVNALARKRLEEIKAADLLFERLLTQISTRFVNLPGNQVHDAIEEAQRQICECVGFDISTLWQWEPGSLGRLALTHYYRALSGPLPPEHMVAEEYFPWSQAKLLANEVVVVPSTEQLPPEAARDREVWRYYGVKTSLSLPLSVGGEPPIGVLSFNDMRQERHWPEELVRRLQLVGQVFTNALIRKNADEQIRESEERLKLAADSAEAGLWTFDVHRNHFWMTARTREIFGFKTEDSVSFELFLGRVHPDDRTLVQQTQQAMLKTREHHRLDFRIVDPRSQTRWVSAHGRVHCHRSGEPLYLAGVTVDVTAQKVVEQTLRESEERFRTLVGNAGDGFELLDERGCYVDVNPATVQQLGYTRQELLGLSIFDVDNLLTREQFTKGSLELLPGTSLRIQSIHRRKDGSVFPVEVTISKIQLKGSPHVLALVHDITERKSAEEALLKSYAEIEQLKDRLQAETDYLKSEMKITQAHGEIVGNGAAIKKVIYLAEQVASTGSSVLITGETGTGKELIANFIHRTSARRDRVMVTVNCAALPSGLVESELFGREKGAYTGALSRQAGRFELADRSTIFLDEIGELSLEAQAKLLRVLEAGELERLGSTKTFRVDVRLIAATNRNLGEEVRKGRFRQDLYYRLNVFPIAIPPLRARVEDLPELVWAFVQEFSTRMGKKITKISRKTMLLLQQYQWPGNVRELRNVIEHSVIVSTGETLRLTIPENPILKSAESKTLADYEREHITQTLESTNWHIKGPRGAARRLGLNPSTLYTRMRKLGIPSRTEKFSHVAER